MNAFQRAKQIILDTTQPRSSVVDQDTEKTLVIIDMQDDFMDENEFIIVPAICELICHAKRNNWGIIVVEYHGYGETHEQICHSLFGYQKCRTVYKGDCDGSYEILSLINNCPGWSQNLLICGIYGPECVAQTVEGLLLDKNHGEIDVVMDAIFPDYLPYDTQEEVAGQTKVSQIINCKQPNQLRSVYSV